MTKVKVIVPTVSMPGLLLLLLLLLLLVVLLLQCFDVIVRRQEGPSSLYKHNM